MPMRKPSGWMLLFVLAFYALGLPHAFAGTTAMDFPETLNAGSRLMGRTDWRISTALELQQTHKRTASSKESSHKDGNQSTRTVRLAGRDGDKS